ATVLLRTSRCAVYSAKPRPVRLMSTFFFQAEDGIRVFHVTGVQTCALPISGGAARPGAARNSPGAGEHARAVTLRRPTRRRSVRSEERRVGEEARPRSNADPRGRHTL